MTTITLGSRVRLRYTAREYTVEALYCTNPLAPEYTEEWAGLKPDSGRLKWRSGVCRNWR